MPSEVVLPSVIVTMILMIVTSTLVALLMHSTHILINTVKDHVDKITKTGLNRVIITNISIVDTREIDNESVFIEFEIQIHNEGSDPIYNMAGCDLILQYHERSGATRAIKLEYGKDWSVIKVKLAESYSVYFSSKPSIGPSETGVIRGKAILRNINLDMPIKVVFTSHYGSTAVRWVYYGSRDQGDYNWQ